jgi:hypothetical protein
MNYLNALGYRGNPNLSATLASQLIDQYRARGGATRSYTPSNYTPQSGAPTAAPNTWNTLSTTVADPELQMALREYLMQSKAGRPSILKKYPKLAAWFAAWKASGKTDADLDKLTTDFLLARRVKSAPSSSSYSNR